MTTAAPEVISGPWGHPSVALVVISVPVAAAGAAGTEKGFNKAAVILTARSPVSNFGFFISLLQIIDLVQHGFPCADKVSIP